MNILQLISTVDPKSGGPLAGMTQLGLWLNANGHYSEVLCLDRPDEVFVHEYPLKINAIGPNSGAYGYNKNIVKWLHDNAHKFDAVIVHGLWQYLGFATWRALKNSKTPYYVYSHGMLGPWFKKNYPLKHIKKWLYWPWAEYRVLRDAKAVLFTCSEEKKLARESFWLYKANEIVAGYGTTSAPENLSKLGDDFTKKYPEILNKQVFLFLGRIHPVKGIDLLVNAFLIVAKDRPDIHLVIAGPDQSQLKSELDRVVLAANMSAQVTWTGMLDMPMKWGAIHSCSAFVLPSHHENFGVVIAESLACGKPVLISNKVNIWREIEQDNAGVVANDDNAGVLFLLEQYLAKTPEEKTEMSVNAFNCFLKRYTVEAMSKSLLKILA